MGEIILTPFFWTALGLFSHALFWAFLSCLKRRADFADIAWGLGFVLVSWISFFLGPFSQIGATATILTTLWGVRLAAHVYLRNRKKEEDSRYAQMRKKGNFFLFIFFKVYLLQSLLLYLISLPVIWANTHPIGYSGVLFWSAIYFWSFGWLIETISDFQLYRFKQKPQNGGKLFTQGFWKYSRHPNYAGELIQWWAIWLLILPSPLGWPLIISPITITVLILFVSGVPLLEKNMKRHLQFEAYAQQTPLLFSPSALNGIFYSAFWIIAVYYAGAQADWPPVLAALFFCALQILLFVYTDPRSASLCLPLAIVAVSLGWLQEIFFIDAGLISYPNETIYPPLWLLLFYPLFSLTLNSALCFLNKNLSAAFFVGGFGAILSYYAGSREGALTLDSWRFYLFSFFSWGSYLTLLILYNRSLLKIYADLSSKKNLEIPLTVIFDGSCKICAKEMSALKKRKQTGAIIYAAPRNEMELKEWTDRFTFAQSMNSIHSFDPQGNIYRGIETLARVYARTNLGWLALFLMAPGFRFAFTIFYWIWAKLRLSTSGY